MTQTSSSGKMAIGQVMVMFAIFGPLCAAWYLLALPAWSVYRTAVVFYSLLAYLSATCSAAALAESSLGGDHDQSILHSALLYSAVVNIGRAVRVLFDPAAIDTMSSPPILVSDLLYVAVFGCLILAAAWRPSGTMHSRLYSIVIIPFASLGAHGILYYLVITQVTQGYLYAVGLCLGIVAAVATTLAGLVWSRLPAGMRVFNVGQMAVAFTLFGVSWAPSVIALFFPSSIWSLAFILRAVGLFVLNVAVASPVLIKLGVKRLRAYEIASIPSLFVFTPVFVTILLEVVAPFFQFVSMETYYLTHLGAAVMSGVMAFLVSAYNQRRPAMNRYPIIWLFIAWSVAQVTLVISAVFYHTAFSETTIPYVIAGLLSLILLPLAVKWTRVPQRADATPVRERFVALFIVSIILTNIVGMALQKYLESEISGLSGSPIGVSLLLSMNVLVMFAVTYLAWTLIVESRGRVSAEVMSVGFLILLVVPTILKGNYADWSSGWWAAEVFLLVTFLFGPAFLGSLYVKELARAESSQNRATLFADLLVHDISNYHQAILVCLNLLEIEDLPAGLREQTLLDANSELMRADSLVRNVRRLGMVDRMAESSFVPVDLVQSILESYRIVARTPTARGLRFSVDKELGQCFVGANSLLTDVFLNLFYNSVQYAKGELVIDAIISLVIREGRNWWEIRVADHSSGIEPERKAKLFERYMDRAHGTGLGLSVVYALVRAFGGSISVEDRVPNDYGKGTVFVITLPAAKGPAAQSTSGSNV